ncbi:MAG: NADH-quinone oxidoreductase subunit NuoE [Dehalococcoidia bacterium]
MSNPSTARDTQVLLEEKEKASEKRLDEILSTYRGEREELIPILQQVQQALGYLPEAVMKRIAKFLRLPESTVFGVVTFYAQFRLAPSGRNIIRVCRGTACHVRGSAQILAEIEKQLGITAGETTPDLKYSLETIACFGSCALAPVVVTNDKVHGRMTATKVVKILNKEPQ